MTGGLAGAGGAPGAAVAGAPPQMPNVGMPALAPHVMPAQTTFASAFASSADPSAAAAGLADPYAQPQAKKQRSEPNGGAGAGMIGVPLLYDGAQGGTTTSTSTAAELSQIKSLMSMLIEQVREVKRENADLREEVLDMRIRLDDNDAIHKRHMDELRREVAAAGLKGPRKGRRSHDSSPSSSSALSLSTTTLANSGNTTANVLESALQRQAIMTTLPFVREYSEYLDSFVLNDVMYSSSPIIARCVCRVLVVCDTTDIARAQDGCVCGVLHGGAQVSRGALRQSAGVRARLAGLLCAHRIHPGSHPSPPPTPPLGAVVLTTLPPSVCRVSCAVRRVRCVCRVCRRS
jgi:hypothetical protein